METGGLNKNAVAGRIEVRASLGSDSSNLGLEWCPDAFDYPLLPFNPQYLPDDKDAWMTAVQKVLVRAVSRQIDNESTYPIQPFWCLDLSNTAEQIAEGELHDMYAHLGLRSWQFRLSGKERRPMIIFTSVIINPDGTLKLKDECDHALLSTVAEVGHLEAELHQNNQSYPMRLLPKPMSMWNRRYHAALFAEYVEAYPFAWGYKDLPVALEGIVEEIRLKRDRYDLVISKFDGSERAVISAVTETRSESDQTPVDKMLASPVTDLAIEVLVKQSLVARRTSKDWKTVNIIGDADEFIRVCAAFEAADLEIGIETKERLRSMLKDNKGYAYYDTEMQLFKQRFGKSFRSIPDSSPAN